MRNVITCSILVLLFSLVSGSAFAEDYETCEDFKKDETFKGAYGLCNAYEQADEEGKLDIFRNWEKKFGTDGPRLPGHPYEEIVILECPCWAGLTDADICLMGNDYTFISYGVGGLLQVNDFLVKPQVSNWFLASGSFCAHVRFVEGEFPSEKPISGLPVELAAQCVAEIEAMGAADFCDGY